MEITFSIIIPTLATEDHIFQVIEEHKQGLQKNLGDSFELIVVINGVSGLSVERTAGTLSQTPLVTVIKLRRAGWGLAIKAGMAVARGRHICYTNAAYAPVSELIKVIKYAKVDEGVVVKGARVIRENKARQWVSFIYNLANRLLLKTPSLDVNAAPKVIPRSLLEKIRLKADDGLLDAELLYHCYKNCFPIVEVPIWWGQRKSGKSYTTWKTALRLATGLLSLKLHELIKKKDKK